METPILDPRLDPPFNFHVRWVVSPAAPFGYQLSHAIVVLVDPYLWLLKSRFYKSHHVGKTIISPCFKVVYSIHLWWFWGWLAIGALSTLFCMQVKDKTFHWISWILILAKILLVQVRWNSWQQLYGRANHPRRIRGNQLKQHGPYFQTAEIAKEFLELQTFLVSHHSAFRRDLERRKQVGLQTHFTKHRLVLSSGRIFTDKVA